MIPGMEILAALGSLAFWYSYHLAYGWAFWGCFFAVALRILLSWKSYQRTRAIVVGLTASFILLWYALFIPAFFALTITWGLTLYPRNGRKGKLPLWRRAALLGIWGFGLLFFLPAATGTAFGKRFYVWEGHALHIAYKSAKLIAAPGDGDTGNRYFYTVSFLGVSQVTSCFTRGSERPFDRNEAKDIQKYQTIKLESFEDEIRTTGNIICPEPFV